MVSDKVMGESVLVYDNGGKTADRYSVAIGLYVFGMSDDALMPNGFNMYSGEKHELPNWRQGKRVRFRTLPKQVQTAIKRRIQQGRKEQYL